MKTLIMASVLGIAGIGAAASAQACSNFGSSNCGLSAAEERQRLKDEELFLDKPIVTVPETWSTFEPVDKPKRGNE
jgi:hypothetical protein